MMTTATPTKLRSGDWGARVHGPAAQGDTIEITTRAGKTWHATVSRVLWSGDGVSIVETQQNRPRSRRNMGLGTWTGCSCGSVEEYEKSGDCASCTHDRY